MAKLKKSKFNVQEIQIGTSGHQGDVFVEKLNATDSDFSTLISGAKKLTDNGIGLTIVLRGEGSNYHALESDVVELYEVQSDIPGIQKMIAKVISKTKLQHIDTNKEALSGEHNTLCLEPGIYEFRSQRQLSLATEDLNQLAESRIQRVTD